VSNAGINVKLAGQPRYGLDPVQVLKRLLDSAERREESGQIKEFSICPVGRSAAT
jgi:hypothetical protein